MPAKMKIVYMITKQAPKGDYHGDSKKSFWTRIGVAFENRDGSLNVKLNAFPISGELHIREYVPRADTTDSRDEDLPF